jgi:NAD(P)H-hydrate epimerase
MHSFHNVCRKNEIVSSKEMKDFEKHQFLKKSSYSFMQNAGRKVFYFIRDKFKKKQPIIVLCGPGNNGGDGFIIAKQLQDYNYPVEVYILKSKKNYKGDALTALEEFNYGLKKISSFKLKKNVIVIDALFGIGLKRNIRGRLSKIFNQINKSNNPVVSVDIPSGVCSNTGEILGNAIKADFTVTFHRKKVGHILGLGREYSGDIKVADIGFIQKKMKTQTLENSPRLWLKHFPWKKKTDHKYSRGKTVIYGGQKEFTGATILSAQAALRTGTGSAKIICSRDTLQIYSLKFPSVLKTEINDIYQLEKFLKTEKITSILIGPGSGSNEKVKKITKLILRKVKYVVLDADALTCFRNDYKSLYSLLDKNKIITPHLGEFHKIFPKIKKNFSNIDKAMSAVKIIKSNIVLKGPNTIIISYNNKIVINNHASSELAVIGSGDVLSGLIVSLIGEKKMNPFLAGCAASWLHGDIAKNYGKGLIAEDIVRCIPSALKRLKKWKTY